MATVTFVGGELDGKTYELPELMPRYKVPTLRRTPDFGADVPPDTPPDIRHTEYTLTVKDGKHFYVENRTAQAINEQGR